MRKLLFVLLFTAGVTAQTTAAQSTSTPPPATMPQAAGQAAPPAVQGGRGQATPPVVAPVVPERPPSLAGATLSSSNIRFDITITDTYGGKPQVKTVSMTVLSGQTGMVRTQNVVAGRYPVRLNVDVQATAFASGLVSTRLTVNYQPAPAEAGAIADSQLREMPGQLEESIAVVLADGKPLVLTESADPVSDRKVTLEAKATILK